VSSLIWQRSTQGAVRQPPARPLGNLWRRLVPPKTIGHWSLAGLQQRLVKTDGQRANLARYYWLLLAETHLRRQLFGALLGRIARLPVPTGHFWLG
jgi:hypothetical protein